jgi:tRNA uridine 5-carboxymethylaminomethyl modification enzyme
MVTEADALRVWPELAAVEPGVLSSLVTDARYAVYVARQDGEVALFRRDQGLRLSAQLDFGTIPGLSHEMVERLYKARPETIGAASRIPGISPAALVALLPYARRRAA